MIKDNVLSALSALGFIPLPIDDWGYHFEYEDIPIIYSVDDDDMQCITFSVPGIFETSDDNRTAVLEAMSTLCSNMKYVQPHIMFTNKVWLNYQHYLGDNEVTPQLLEHIIRVLAYATTSFHKIINGENNDD